MRLLDGTISNRMRGASRPGALGLVLLAGLVATSAHADPRLLSPPTPPGGGPVVVRMTFDLRDVNEIDDEIETFEFEAITILEWHDARQAFDPEEVGVSEKFFQGGFQFNEVFDGWYPQLVLMNESGLFEKHGVLLRVLPDGSCRLIETINAAAKTDLDLKWHPLDRQTLEAEFEILGFDENEVALVIEEIPEELQVDLASIRVPQWTVVGVDFSVRSGRAPHAGVTNTSSTFVVVIDIDRKALFMVRLVVFPLLLIVLLSWSVFWMEQSSLGDRISVSFIGILTVVSYQIILSDFLPRISYLTLMNGFLNVSFVVVCASVLVNLRVGYLDRIGNNAAGDRIDRICRWAFPTAYVLLLCVVMAVGFVMGR